MSLSLVRTSVIVAVLAGGAWSLGWGPDGSVPAGPGEEAQEPTAWDESALWLTPADDVVDETALNQAARLLATGDGDEALTLVQSARPDAALAPYAELIQARALLMVERPGDAVRSARQLLERTSGGHLRESALRVLGEALEQTGEWGEAATVWQTLAELAPNDPADVTLRLAQSAENAGDRALAETTYSRVFYEWPETEAAREAEEAMARLSPQPLAATVERELGRAARLYEARRFSDAYDTYSRMRGRATGAERQLVDLRLAQTDIHLQRYTRGLRELEAYLSQPAAPDRDEAGYFALTAARGLKRADYPARVARFVAEHPDSAFAEAAMNDLATHFILADDDARAADVFAEMYARWPEGRFADRAAWRAGWWAYRADDYRRTIEFFARAATTLRRADYRPAWLYWTARSYAALGQHDTARLWFLRAIADYRNSYYGRLALAGFESLVGLPPSTAAIAAERDPTRAIQPSTPPPNASIIIDLLDAGLWDEAIAELRRGPSARSPMIEATIAYALNRKGELRPAITAMRRAYPQFMSDGGERLPERILKVIFPVAHVETLRRYSTDRGIDPHLLTALVAQESTFQVDVVSPANAVGLMQLLPATGRRYAPRVGVVGFSNRTLTDPDANVRLGTAYLSDLLARYGGDVAPALAAYNAGENRVDRWRTERRGVPGDEFVDDIPFPETQNYVKRILGTAADYRQLYPAIGTAGDPLRP